MEPISYAAAVEYLQAVRLMFGNAEQIQAVRCIETVDQLKALGIVRSDCDECGGSGDCPECGQDCVECSGSGEVDIDHDDLTEKEALQIIAQYEDRHAQ